MIKIPKIYPRIKNFNILLVIILSVILIIEYYIFVVPLYSYYGFKLDPSWIRICEGIVWFFISLLPLRSKKTTGWLLAILYLVFILFVLPNLLLFMLADSDRIIVYSNLLFYFTVYYSRLISFNFLERIPKLNLRQSYILLFLLCALLFIPFFAIYGFDLNSNVLLLKDIYSVRFSSAKELTTLTAYSYHVLGKVLLPILLIMSLSNRNYLVAIIVIFGFVYLFLIAALKALFFSILLILVLYLFTNYKNKITLILLFFIAIILIGRFITFAFHNDEIESLMVRRMFYLPALLNDHYFEFFHDKPIYYSSSFLSGFIHYPYPLDPPHLIGEHYFSKPEMRANNGIISDGYINLGYAGILFNIIISTLIISFFDRQKINPRYFGIFFVMIYVFQGSALFTGLLTHGIFYLMVLCLFVLRNSE